MYEDFFSILVFVFVGSFLIKIITWLAITDISRKPSFWTSFIRLYSIYHLHDAPSKRTLQFWKLSNILNLFFWLSLIMIGYYGLNIVLKPPVS